MGEKLLPKATVEYVLSKLGSFLRDAASAPILCIDEFASLVNVKRFPSRVRVVASTRPIAGAAKVYVRKLPDYCVDDYTGEVLGEDDYAWMDWNGVSRELTIPAEWVLKGFGVTDEWLPIWIDFKRVRADAKLTEIVAPV